MKDKTATGLTQAVKVEGQTQSPSCPSQQGDQNAKKCMKPGSLTNNGYLNFLREFREKNCNLSPIEVVRQGAKAWNALSCEEKMKYKMLAKLHGTKRSRKTKRKSMARHSMCGMRSRSRSRSSSRNSCGRQAASNCSVRGRSRGRGRGRGRGRKRNHSRSRSPRGSKSRSRSQQSLKRRRSGSRSKRAASKCARAGPVTSNPYLNFLRTFRRCNCGLNQREVFRRGARRWASLSDEDRKRYIIMACRAARSKYSRRKAICREVNKRRS